MRWRTPDPIDQAIQRMRAVNAAQAQQTQLRADIAADRERQLMANISARGADLGHDPDTVRAVQEAARAEIRHHGLAPEQVSGADDDEWMNPDTFADDDDHGPGVVHDTDEYTARPQTITPHTDDHTDVDGM